LASLGRPLLHRAAFPVRTLFALMTVPGFFQHAPESLLALGLRTRGTLVPVHRPETAAGQ
jgi:hypothetical protein